MPKLPIAAPRNRIINFRLTEDEYNSLKSSCTVQGSRCLSDYARAAVLSQSSPGSAGLDSIQTRLSDLDQRIADLGGQVYRLLEILDRGPERDN